MAAAWIRITYENVTTRDSIASPLREGQPLQGRPVARYVAYQNMDQFLELAEMHQLQFTFDYSGDLLSPSLHRIPILVTKRDADTLDMILGALDRHNMRTHITQETNLKYLDDNVRIEEIRSSAIKGSRNLPSAAGMNATDASLQEFF